MKFNTRLKIILRFSLVLSLLFQIGCGEFLNGKPKKEEVIEVRRESLSCLKSVSASWTKLVKFNSSEADVDFLFSCFESTLNEFQSHGNGAVESHSFTNAELFQIFNTYIKDAEISQETTDHLLLLKSAILGGVSDKITKKEILDLRHYLGLLKVEVKLILPYTDIFKFDNQLKISQTKLNEGYLQLNSSLKKLLKASQLYKSDYQFSDLERLIKSLNLFDEKQNDLFKLAEKVRDLLVGTETVDSEADYLFFIDNIVEVLRLYSYHLHSVVKFEIQDPVLMNNTVQYVQDWVQLLENSIQFKKNKIIDVSTLDPVLSEISKRGFIPIQVKDQTLLDLYKLVIMRVFDSSHISDQGLFRGLTLEHLSGLKKEINIFKMSMQFVSDIAAGKDRISLATVQKKLAEYSVEKVDWFKKLDSFSQKFVKNSFEEFKTELMSERPVIYRFNKMVIAANQEVWDQNWQDLARAQYVKMLSRELLIGWGNAFSTKLVTNSYLTEQQLVDWYSDFKDFGREIKFFDPRSEDAASVSFKQANLLTYAANGDDKMNFFETVQFLNLLISGGSQTLDEMYVGFKQANCQLPELDVFGENWIVEKCLMTDLRTNFKYYFSNLSYLNQFVSQLSEKEFKEFYNGLMEISRIEPSLAGQKVETADLRAVSILLHYIESLYARFDADRNWTFSANEIRSSYPRFKNFAIQYAHDNAQEDIDEFNSLLAQTIGGYGCYSEPDLIKESFIFLVYTGKTPKKADLNSFPCLLHKPLIDFSGEVDRKKIINTFKILKSVLG